MRPKNVLLLGILLCNTCIPSALLSISLPHSAQAASVKAANSPVQTTYFISLLRGKNTVQKAGVSAAKPAAIAKGERLLLSVVDQTDIEMKHRIIADEVLRLMPEACRGTLKNFYVRYDNPEQRGLAGKNTLIISGDVEDYEFRALLIHELGHVFDLSNAPGCLGGTAKSGASAFKDGTDVIFNDDPSIGFYRISWKNEKTKNQGAQSQDFVTGYASWDAFEDFAESFVYFVLQNDAFRERAQSNAVLSAKYQWLRTHFAGIMQLASGEAAQKGVVPWDATKLAYVWQPNRQIAVMK